MTLAIEELSVSLQAQRIVHQVRIDVPTGAIVGLVGPNGSGKTTLLRAVYRALRPDAGSIVLDGDDLLALPVRACAQRMAAVLQEHETEFDYSVADVVAMGRSPHKGLFERDTAEDRHSVERALAQVSLSRLADRSFGSLSGGEKQRALIARALAQQVRFLVLDEPTNNLDVRHQLEIMDLLVELPVTALIALHDLNLAASYCDRLYALCDGEVVAAGHPREVITPALMKAVFAVEALVVPHPLGGAPQLLYTPDRLAMKETLPCDA